MGSQHSKNEVYTSKSSDTLQNLEWALQSRFDWEQRTHEAERLLLGKKFGRTDSLLQNRSTAVDVQNEMMNARKVQLEAEEALLSSLTKKRRKSYLSELDSSRSSMHTQAAIGQSASAIFGAGAAAQLASSANTGSSTSSTPGSATGSQDRGIAGSNVTSSEMAGNLGTDSKQSGMVGSQDLTSSNLNNRSGLNNAEAGSMRDNTKTTTSTGKPGVIERISDKLTGQHNVGTTTTREQGMMGTTGQQGGLLGQQGMMGNRRADNTNIDRANTWSNPDYGSNERWMSRSMQQGGNPQGVSAEEHLSKLQKGCIAKFLFIHSLLDKCLRNAEYCYMLSHRSSLTKKALKSRRSSDPSVLTNTQAEQRMSEGYLTEALANFDRASETHRWAVRDYDLSVALFKVETTLLKLGQINRDVHSSETGPAAPLTLQLDNMIQDLYKSKQHILTAIHRNDRGALNLGFNYLDQNRNGLLESRHLQGMSPQLMRMFQVDENHRLSRQSLQGAIDEQTTHVDNCVQRIKMLELENARLAAEGDTRNHQTMQSNLNEINKLSLESQQSSNTLADLYEFFLAAFARSIFSDLDTSDIASRELDRNNLTTALQRMSIETFQDPLNMPPADSSAVHALQKEAAIGIQHVMYPEAQIRTGAQQQLQQQPLQQSALNNNNVGMTSNLSSLPQQNLQQQPSSSLSSVAQGGLMGQQAYPLQEKHLPRIEQQPQLLQTNMPVAGAMPPAQQPSNLQQSGSQLPLGAAAASSLGGMHTQSQNQQIQDLAAGKVERSNSGFQGRQQQQSQLPLSSDQQNLQQQQQPMASYEIQREPLQQQPSQQQSNLPFSADKATQEPVYEYSKDENLYNQQGNVGTSSLRPGVDQQSMLPVNKQQQLPLDSTVDKERPIYQ